jgi:hypothetical protein
MAEVDVVERRIKYDARMGHAPPLSDVELDKRLRAVGLQLEEVEREHCREAVGNTLSDGLGTVLLFTGFWFNRGRLRALRKGIFARFLSLEVSTQAFLLLLAADVTVGYHSSDGWVTFVELLVARYNVDGPEDAENVIRLFVAVVPVVLDVTFKCASPMPQCLRHCVLHQPALPPQRLGLQISSKVVTWHADHPFRH